MEQKPVGSFQLMAATNPWEASKRGKVQKLAPSANGKGERTDSDRLPKSAEKSAKEYTRCPHQSKQATKRHLHVTKSPNMDNNPTLGLTFKPLAFG